MEPSLHCFTDDEVPEPFRSVTCFARRFGHPEYTERVSPELATASELMEFWSAVSPLRDEISKWLDTFSKKHSWPDSAAAYLYMLQALDYAEPESHEQAVRKQQFLKSTIYPNLVKKACSAAGTECQNRNFSGVIALLEPYEDDLPEVATAKLKQARKRVR